MQILGCRVGSIVSVLDGWRLCPRCGSQLERGEGRVHCPACDFAAYANPAPTACALCVDSQGRLLLGRRAHEPYRGRWDVPGGFLEEDEHPLDCLRRELREETGLEVEPAEFFGVWVDRYGPGERDPVTLNLYWVARVVDGEARAADDVVELRWFALDELPGPDELAFSTVADVLAAFREQQS
jgi:ADP-ribose pyrophosphatase YjhB (NUDIX family)